MRSSRGDERNVRSPTVESGGAALRLEAVIRSLPGGRSVGPIDLEVASGEIVGFTGPSGCGKSTLLRSITGLEGDLTGRIEVDGIGVDRRAPGRRDIVLVEQHLPLYEHLSARENVEMAVSGVRLDRSDRDHRIEDAMRSLDVLDFADRRADALSGGERARTCLARVLARRSRVALLDEPFAGLDERSRDLVRERTIAGLRACGSGVILVTHDRDDLSKVDRSMRFDDHGRVTPPSD